MYLRSRGIGTNDIPDDADMRWHPRCPWQQGCMPCLVVLFTDALTGEPKGIQRTAIVGGRKLETEPNKMSLGPSAGSVIRLWHDVEQGLVVGEGLETVLAAATQVSHRGTLLRPAWAATSAKNLAGLPVLPGVEALTILVDNDTAGIDAAAECSTRWTSAGREVTRLIPNIADVDFADIVEEIR
jgi:Toprim domain